MEISKDTTHTQEATEQVSSVVSKEDRDAAMIAYCMMLASLALGITLFVSIINLVAAGIYYIVVRNKGSFVRFHALQSLLSQIPISIVNMFVVVISLYRLFLYIGDEIPVFTPNYIAIVLFVLLLNAIYIVYSICATVQSI